MTESITQIATQQKVKTTTKINLVIGMVSAIFIGLALFNNAFLLGPVGWEKSFSATATDTIAPTVVVSSPLNNQEISGSFNITTTLTDDTAVAKVEFYLDGALRYIEHLPKSNWVYPWDTTRVSNGDHVFLIKVYDQASNETVVNPIKAKVNN